ncbi:hypothetical protein K470DRAFT_260763 [Piedraia hortae CBS 480.64]|uniref:GPI-anchored wall transfer protein n=1 Tax=Piedraia hortae CBS 480.64 TaxID=1314780 RepID=A0A6A7BRJ1_9PEZI|nr:hypothetical protein K470DRAFT_260763 [Piedraia hortae CBS 480.64]
MSDYKSEKIASVSHLSGGGIWEINFVTVIAPAAAFLWSVLQTRQRFFTPYTTPAAVTDFLLNCCAILFATTVYSSSPQVLLGILLLPALATYLQPPEGGNNAQRRHASQGAQVTQGRGEEGKGKDALPIKPFITMYRGAMMIITCSSILAVDFPVFPRRFAKTESFGTSLMDLGVGSFVFAAGVVAARRDLKRRMSFVRGLGEAVRSSLVLAILGLVRLYSVKGLDYAEHVSEYGVHWNFFFTLALLPPVVALLAPLLRVIKFYNVFAFLLAVAYEVSLDVFELKAYIILSERKTGDFISQNREGVFSFVGYLAIFLAGMGIGQCILPRDPSPEEIRLKAKEKDPLDEDSDWLATVLNASEQKSTANPIAKSWTDQPKPLRPELPQTSLGMLALSAGLWFVASVWAMWRYGPRLFVSRRMANLAYVCWTCSFNTAMLLLFCAIERVMFPNIYKGTSEKKKCNEATSRAMHVFNRNGLVLFLLANLMTGGINIAIPTWYTGDTAAMAILTTYMAVLFGAGLALDHYNITVRL